MISTSRSLQLLHGLLWLVCVQGHGRLIEPPSRSSMWRFGYDTPINYNDNQLYCGGYGVLYSTDNDGQCGVCGDPHNGPFENEAGGKYALGLIVKNYQVGQMINVTVDLTDTHKGFFEFRLCRKDDPFQKATWKCLNKNPLVIGKTNKTRYPISFVSHASRIDVQLRLPKHLTCKACVLQWKYVTANSWGVEPNGVVCIGCGHQEQFYSCADVAIGHPDTELAIRNRGKSCIYMQVEKSQWMWDCSGRTSDGTGLLMNPETGKGTSGAFPVRPFPSPELVFCSMFFCLIVNTLVGLGFTFI